MAGISSFYKVPQVILMCCQGCGKIDQKKWMPCSLIKIMALQLESGSTSVEPHNLHPLEKKNDGNQGRPSL